MLHLLGVNASVKCVKYKSIFSSFYLVTHTSPKVQFGKHGSSTPGSHRVARDRYRLDFSNTGAKTTLLKTVAMPEPIPSLN
uniref:Uncharacterized protein n=1 Tax=Anguilla anguilla TaxID=7936 RepID=A0A0E9SAJ7_ANGAN